MLEKKHGKMILGLQYIFAMFEATVLVPFVTGLNPIIAILSSELRTLLFHLESLL